MRNKILTASGNRQTTASAMTRLFSIVHFRSAFAFCLVVTALVAAITQLAHHGEKQIPAAVRLASLVVPAAVSLGFLSLWVVPLRPHLRDMNQMQAGRNWAHWRYLVRKATKRKTRGEHRAPVDRGIRSMTAALGC
ncbi:hypothetical protein HS041_28860 [Planomonospora sp. ID67723]|uniref:hypothetical protein n=1 Tax=Planomonospora sp. ID67723 TaxID=2738134 RepID=UPI0018C40ACD|nr:hypothetical protein [Planomonospora sp. ID67723]MBG0831736.1 hypothetical protein [Planomonospora sp. ID67723]